MSDLLRMNPRKKPIAARFFALALLVMPSANAQPRTLTADEAVDMALLRPDIANLIDADVGMANSELIAARTWPNPQLSLERETASGPGSGDEHVFMLSQRFDLGGQRGLQRRAAELRLSAAKTTAAAERELIRVQVLQRYYTVVAATRRTEAHRAWVVELDELGRVAASRAAEGDLSGYEARRIQQSGVLARLRLDEVATTLLMAREQLASLIGGHADRILVDERVDLLPDLGRFIDEFDDRPLANARIAALDGQRTATAAAVQAARRPSLPVTVSLGQRRLKGPVGSDDALLLALSVPLPLFDRNQAARARAQAESLRADSRYEMAVRDMHSRRKLAQAEAVRLVAAAEQLRTDVVPEAQELTRIARNSFAEGELGLVELLAAFDSEIGAINQSLDLQYRAREAWIELKQLLRHDSSTIDPSTSGAMP